MSEPFIAEIRIFPYDFAPRDWAFCDGQVLPIAQNTALFALIGTIYGGDGRTTVGLPNLQGRAPMAHGTGPGLTPRNIGQRGGAETHTLTANEMGAHTHALRGNSAGANERFPAGNVYAASAAGLPQYGSPENAGMKTGVIGQTGGGQAHNNMQPFTVLNFCIALQGTFPSRT